MPLILPSGLPAISTLATENIPLTLTDGKAAAGSVAPIRIAVLNLMPQKIESYLMRFFRKPAFREPQAELSTRQRKPRKLRTVLDIRCLYAHPTCWVDRE